ncbi:MAG: M23 family metallopeptidase [Lachnospiraceae bacterium]|nr:M23 family metallopeptidase [Lachnospiraceae bacterium]
MKNQRHKRKESFSVLLISNTDRSSRQFQISYFTIRLLIFLLVFICVATGCMTYFTITGYKKQKAVQTQLASLEQLNQQLEADKAALMQDKLVLSTENSSLSQQVEALHTKEAEEASESESEEETEPVPSRYPSDGTGVLKSTYSEEQPYIAISAYTDGNIVAAGDGTVIAVGSDDTYHHIIEVEHEGGYKTRYLCHQEAELKTEEGAQVQSGDVLLTIKTDDSQLDYQVLLNDEPLDPLSVIDAKG